MMSAFNNIANTNTVNYVPVQATFDASGGFLTFIGPGGVPFTAGGSLSINTTAITGGTSGRVLFNNAGTVGEKAVTGTGDVVLSDSPTFTTAISSTGALLLGGSAAANQNIATSQTSGTLTIGGASATGALTIGQSTSTQPITIGGDGTGTITVGQASGNQTVNIASIGNVSGSTKTLNIGINGQASSTTNIAIGATDGTSTTTINGAITTSATIQSIDLGTNQTTGTLTIGGTAGTGNIRLGQSTGNQSVNIATGATISGSTKTINLGTGGTSGSTTTIGIGGTASTVTVTIRGLINGRVYTVSTLPAGIAGSRAFVSDATGAVTFNSLVVGGGSNGVPVYHDGTSWKVG